MKTLVRALILFAVSACGPLLGQLRSGARAAGPEFHWGGDSEGGAPFVEADPADPSKIRGFDVEVAETIARGLSRTPRFVQVAFSSIDQSVERGDFEIGMSGVEETPARQRAHAVTIPYFEFREVLTVRVADQERIRTMNDLAGRRVGTLAGTIAYDILLEWQKNKGIQPVSYDDDVHPYSDLAEGRLDAVLLDHIIAARSTRRVPGLATLAAPVARGHYVGVLAKGSGPLRDQVNEVLKGAMRDGTLEQIYRRWGIWDEDEGLLFRRLLEPKVPGVGDAPATAPVSAGGLSAALVFRYVPALLRASAVTLALSVLAMALAVVLGVGLASGRVYGGPVTRALLTAYVELMRGTPVLLQLFVLYYGLSSVIRLPAFAAALLGLGLNYAAYESEIYRGALEAVAKGQLEAARTLGFSERQILVLIRGPQAFRLALAPMTNDFVALLKDSSLVSVITVVELTKQTSIFATNVGSWVVPGILCAGLYLALSFPLSRLAARLETRWKAATR